MRDEILSGETLRSGWRWVQPVDARSFSLGAGSSGLRRFRKIERFSRSQDVELIPQHQNFGFKPSSRDLKQSYSTRTKRKAIANIQSCSDTPAIAKPMDGVFGTNRLITSHEKMSDAESDHPKCHAN